MDRINLIKKQIKDSADTKERLLSDEAVIKKIDEIASLCTQAYKNGGKIMWCGNGGSAADAQHLAGELVNKFYFDRPGLPSISLSTDPSIVSAISNDYGYDTVFAHQVQAQGQKGDILIGISTSGNSKNIVAALPECRKKGIISVALVGSKPCKMDEFDYVVKIPSDETPRIQECQTLIGHILCCIIEQNLFGDLDPNR
ncbi:MAG: D-sedoheptulose 7-phosphate isomerase [Bacteroidales bacterium]